MQRLCGAGGTGNHADGGGTSASQILVRQVEKFLIVGVGVNGGHRAGLDAEGVVKNLGDGREAIGGAGRVGNDVVLGGIVSLVVHAEHERGDPGRRPARR